MHVLATVRHDGHVICIKRDAEPSVGNPTPFTYIHVDGKFMGEVLPSRVDEDHLLQARFNVIDGYGAVMVQRAGVTLTDALHEAAEAIVGLFRAVYPKVS